VATCEQMSFCFEKKPADDRNSVAVTATQIKQELRRPRPEAPRLSTALEPVLDPMEEHRVRLEKRIAAHLPGGRLALALTDNRFTMISVKRERGPVYRVRLHQMFTEAPPPVTRALALYIAVNDHTASRELGRFIDAHQTEIRRPVTRTAPPLVTLGRYFDLRAVFDRLNQQYFQNAIDARIGWGARGGRRRRRRSLKMGSYSVEDRLIRIHPALDRDFVPEMFLEWIVYHEMLHQVHDIPVVDGRRQFHTPEFLAQERQFAHYEQARLWERRNLDRLLHF
jgi:hypothetical protein